MTRRNRKRKRKGIDVLRWLVLAILFVGICLPIMGEATISEGSAENVFIVEYVESAIESVPIGEPKPERGAQRSKSDTDVNTRPEAEPIDESDPTKEPDPTREPEPSPTPDPTPEPDPEPTSEPPPESSPDPTDEPPPEATPTPTRTPTPPTQPPPTPAPHALYTLAVDVALAWTNAPQKIVVRIEDVNGAGWQNLSAQIIGKKGAQDISEPLAAKGSVTVELSENSDVYVIIIDSNGETHELFQQIICFDFAVPEIKTKIDGRVLRMKATDDLSGVAHICVNDQIFEDSNDGALDVAIKKLENYTEYKQLTIYAVDLAGNQSESVKQKNPLYKSSSGSSSNGGGGGGSAPPIIPSTSTASTMPTATATPAPTAMPIALAPTPIPTPEPTAAPNPFTPNGTGTVMNYAGSKDSKEFYVVTTPNENTFYLVIDRNRGTENVYFLDAVSERDLMTLTGPSDYVEPTPEPTVAPVATPEPTHIPEPPLEPPKQGNGSMVLILVIVALGAGGAGYYFKILKPKQQPEMEEYEDYDDDEEMTRDDGPYDDDDMDDPE